MEWREGLVWGKKDGGWSLSTQNVSDLMLKKEHMLLMIELTVVSNHLGVVYIYDVHKKWFT